MTRAAKVARIPYLNTAPFYVRWDRLEEASEGRWVPAVLPPRQLGMAAEAGEVDAGVLALADLIRLEETFEPLPVPSAGAPVTFGIANRGRVDSVLLFLRGNEPGDVPEVAGRGRVLTPAEAEGLGGSIIGVTGESSTSFRLLRLLCEVRHRVQPAEYRRLDLARPAPPEVNAALVIGDLALRWRHAPPPGFYLAMDLAAGWHEWTGLPFVFARWGVRRALDPEQKAWLGRFLEESLESAQEGFDELVCGLPADLGPAGDLVTYLRNFTFRLGPEELHAASLFRRLLHENGIVCSSA